MTVYWICLVCFLTKKTDSHHRTLWSNWTQFPCQDYTISVPLVSPQQFRIRRLVCWSGTRHVEKKTRRYKTEWMTMLLENLVRCSLMKHTLLSRTQKGTEGDTQVKGSIDTDQVMPTPTAVEQSEEEATNRNQDQEPVKRIRSYYVKGTCRHGISGKGCPYEHPSPCKRLLKH